MKEFKNPKENRIKTNRFSTSSVIMFVLLILYVAIFFIIIGWALISAFTNIDDYFSFYVYNDELLKIPLKKTFDNFKTIYTQLYVLSSVSQKQYKIFDLYLVSLLYSGGCALCFTLVPCVVGYATARFKYKFSKVIYTFVIITMALPIVGSTASEIKMLYNLGIYGKFYSMFILRFNFLSVYYLIFYAQFEMIPKDYTEAAKIDGASNMNIMLSVIMPQAAGTIVTVFILSFINYWNDFQIPLLYLPNYPTAAYCIYCLVNGLTTVTDVPIQLAGTFIMALPIVLIYIIFNKQFRVSVAVGGIKG